MKKILTSFLFTIVCFANAQLKISGKVLDQNNESLIGASVYLNNTSIGTITNDVGEFELIIDFGTHELIVSYLGYETIQYQLDTKKPTRKFTFKTKAANNLLDEIVIKSRKYSKQQRSQFLAKFKSTFIGTTKLSKDCKILNKDVLYFAYDGEKDILEGFANEPIEILHSGLGYKIYYDLVMFELTPEKVTYLGYARYKDLKASRRKKRKWKKARKLAYNGSRVHFVRSLREGKFSDEGFVIDQFKRIPNPNRPSDEEIKKARDYIRSIRGLGNSVDVSRNFVINLVNPNEKPNSKLDSAQAIVSKSRLKKFNDISLRKNLKTEDIIFNSPQGIKIKFKDYLKISYLNEKEEYSFRPGAIRLDYQVSKMTMLASDAILDSTGEIIDPLDVFVEGYWGYEKIADTLPLDYYPDNN